MKNDEYEIQRPTFTYSNGHPPNHGQQSIEAPPPAKRPKRVLENINENGALTHIPSDDSTKSNQCAVKEKRLNVRLSKSMSKIGSQISVQKVASPSIASVNVTAPSTNAVEIASSAEAVANCFEIKRVQSLRKEPAVANNDQQKKIATKNVIKKIRLIPASKIPGRRTNVVTPAGKVNAQSTPIVKKPIPMPQDPLAIDEPAATAAAALATTTELTIEPSIQVESVHPAFHGKVAVLKMANKQLSTSLPMITIPGTPTAPATPTTPTTPQTNGILTRSRNNQNAETPKRLHQCDSCAFTSEVYQNLLRHMMVHTGKKPQMCKTCGKRFPSKSVLLAHKREYHRELHTDVAYWETN